ncbi:uncharacterized protein LOC131437945 isoform X2 [Malaya genurostris]|uniref:uncharacterized protein LOC131437945 isoform X2 n=1 Tax=Malaya genurostris TaxID=325434 RepID=UPI0026F37EC3|nr:uncharacterized protein LOC131437945 isoform X2 [Malaya genurostris]
MKRFGNPMDSPVPSTMNFSTFVLELNQSPLVDYTSGNNKSSNRNCCLPESRVSQDFENTMQMMMSNYDLDDDDKLSLAAAPVLRSDCYDSDREESANDSAFSLDRESHESLETTLDNDDDPLELTEEDFDDSGDAADGGSSDEQQHSRSLSLSFSLSSYRAQENFSQYSQSTDKGLSKRYDSPCSYEDDRESECTNFDKLDDWNDFINDMQNNNNGDATTRDFREYYDEYLASKGQAGIPVSRTGSGTERSSDENESKESTSSCGDGETVQLAAMMIDRPADPHPNTPVSVHQTTVTEKCRTFLEYRNPACEFDDEPVASEEMWDEVVSHQNSFKRKFCYEDRDDYDYEVTELITEKFRKTDIVPDHGSHEPISLIDEQQFNRLTQMESPSKTPVPGKLAAESENNNRTNETEDIDLIDCTVVTTPTNHRILRQTFPKLTDNSKLSQSTTVARECDFNTKHRRSMIGTPTSELVTRSPLTSVTAHRRSNLNLSLINAPDNSH